MGKVDCLCNSVEPFAFLFWAADILLANTLTCLSAWHHSTAVHKACPYMAQLFPFSTKTRLLPPLFLSRYVIYLWVPH